MRVDFTAGPDDHDRRLESILRRLLPSQSLGTIQKALRTGDIRLNGAKAAPDARVQVGDTLSVWDRLTTPATAAPAAPPAAPVPDAWILYDGDDLVVVNKPSGVLVHRGDAQVTGGAPPLDERVRARLAPSARDNLGFRPGPLHRLDKETSGLVVFSKTLVGARSFSAAMAARQVEKRYLAVVSGVLSRAADVELALVRDEGTRTSSPGDAGETATTRFLPLASSSDLTLVEVLLGTGRTHQIRVHAQALGHPLAGDRKYGGPPTPPGWSVPWFLHAWKLTAPGLPPLRAPFSEEFVVWLKKTFKFSV
jgi:23S rRNA pseudouridine955/2504/2580 synthase